MPTEIEALSWKQKDNKSSQKDCQGVNSILHCLFLVLNDINGKENRQQIDTN